LRPARAGEGQAPLEFFNWSGYAATAASPFLQAQTTYTQPAASCPVPRAWTVFWVGFDGFQNETVEQAGTAAQCLGESSEPVYYAWWEMYPTNMIQVTPIKINPGDKIVAKVAFNPRTNKFSLGVMDTTDKEHFTEVTACAAQLKCERASAEWIVERPTVEGSFAPLADWGTMLLKGDRAAVAAMPSEPKPTMQPLSAFSNSAITMVNSPEANEQLAAPGPLNRMGIRFGDTWLAAQ
jgi:hypothetical protein